MKVIHSGSCNVRAGGPALSTWLTIKGLRQQGINTDIITTPPTEVNNLIDNNLTPIYTSKSILPPFAYVPHLGGLLKSLPAPDLFHIQGVWMLHGYQVARFARQRGIPYVVTLRGMLYPQAMAHHSLQKRLSMLLYQRKVLEEASAIQCTCEEEMQHYRNLGFKNPVAIIPNPIEISPLQPLSTAKNEGFRIGYLGRVHPRKRIERLIYAIDHLKSRQHIPATLLIIGSGDREYENFLRNEVERLGLQAEVFFLGFLTGEEKSEAISSLSVLAVPSDFENFGNIVTEALSLGIPVIASKGMPWQELATHDCGWWIPNDQDSIDRTLTAAYGCGAERLEAMGRNGRKWMEEDFSVEALGLKMKQLYEYILGEGSKPEFVYI